MSDEIRKPLVQPPQEERDANLKAMGMVRDGDEVYMANRSELEVEADKHAAEAPNPTAEEELSMETKPGYKTSEFWMTLLAKAVVAAIAYFTVSGGPLDQIATAVTTGAPILALIAPLAKTALAGLLGYLATKLATKYVESRTEVKTAASQG
jgi:hypothetical protein